MRKVDIRKIMLEKRKSLTQKECAYLDDLLLIQFQKFNWSSIHCIGSFYPIEAMNEPNTLLLTRYLKLMFPTLVIAYPKIDEKNGVFTFFEETENFIHHKWGIKEPMPIHQIDASRLDLILVPLLGFDENGNRVGFGKGYYDKFFYNTKYTNFKMGISYFDPITKILDTDQFDVPLTHCITPWKCYEF
jgi:5-formyltetrahydrofolate cyclo-ligase